MDDRSAGFFFCFLGFGGRDFAKAQSPSQGVLHKRITATIKCKQKKPYLNMEDGWHCRGVSTI